MLLTSDGSLEHLEQSASRSLRGSARGKVFKALVTKRATEFGFFKLADVLIDFNRRYSPPMTQHSANALVNQLLDSNTLVRLAQGLYGTAARGPVLPRLKAVHPAAYDVFMALVKRYPTSYPTKRLIDLTGASTGRWLKRHELYEALYALERNGMVRWDKTVSALNIHHARPAELLGGHCPTDLRALVADAPRLDEATDHPDIVALERKLKQRSDDTLTDEELEAKKPSDPSIFD